MSYRSNFGNFHDFHIDLSYVKLLCGGFFDWSFFSDHSLIGEWSLNPDWMIPAEENSSGAGVISK